MCERDADKAAMADGLRKAFSVRDDTPPDFEDILRRIAEADRALSDAAGERRSTTRGVPAMATR